MRPSQAFQVLETLRNHSSVPLTRKGVVLSDYDSQTTRDVYQQWLALLLDLGYLHPETLVRDARRLWSDLNHADVLSLNNCFAECLQLIRLQSNRGFKALCSGISPHLYPLIKNDLDLIPLGDVGAARRLVQLFSYTSRLSLRDIDLTQQMLDDYRAVEESIPDVYPEIIVRRLNKIIRRWIGSFGPPQIVPGHGPGGVAGRGRCSLEVKYNDLATDQRLEYSFGNPWWIVKPGNALDRTSQTIFVAKSYKTFRTISMEPATLQYFQQGVWRQIEELVNRSYFLRNHIGFKDQSRNRKLAQEGSILRNYATIDLSSASDSVGYQLVKSLFRRTWLMRYIVSTRSTKTKLPDGSIIELKKFAPMGSSLCFPIETIIFASICDLVTRDHRRSGDFSVYGDDIIVPSECSETVISILETLGFRVNRDKSFIDSTCWFRESCGGEYCDGYDVTPMRVSRKYAATEDDVRTAKLASLANSAYLKGFKHLRYFFLMKLRSNKIVPLFSPTEILADNYTNYHTKLRWNFLLHRLEAKVDTFVSTPGKERCKQNEELRLRHWFESTAQRSSLGDGFESVICRTTVVKRRSWRMKPYELSDRELIESFSKKARIPSLEERKGGKV